MDDLIKFPLLIVSGLGTIHEKGINFRNMIEENHGSFCNELKVFGNEILWKWEWMQ
jgi:hypothetical protein